MSPPRTDDGVDETTLHHFLARAVLGATDRQVARSPDLDAAQLAKAIIGRLVAGVDGHALTRVVNIAAHVEGQLPAAKGGGL